MTKTITFPENQELKEGDWVEHISTGKKYEVVVGFEGDEDYPFFATGFSSVISITKEGKTCSSHIRPTFIKCDPPKVKKKFKVSCFLNIYSDGAVRVHSSRSAATNLAVGSEAVAVAHPFETEIEIEVDA